MDKLDSIEVVRAKLHKYKERLRELENEKRRRGLYNNFSEKRIKQEQEKVIVMINN